MFSSTSEIFTLKNVSFGAIGNYIGNRVGGWNNQVDPTKPNGIWDRELPIDGYTTVDVSIGYTWEQFSLLCKLSNITNELNYTVHENYSVNPIAPRQILTSLRYKF
jgi:iron complex outermembrane receptor protein